MTEAISCRECGEPMGAPFIDLGKMPLANAFLKPEQLDKPEMVFPLRVYFCSYCLLVQAEQFSAPEDIFSDYVYFSSWSHSWLKHATKYVGNIVEMMGLDKNSFVVEVASNDGYLLRNFVESEIPCLGIEPAANVAKVAIDNGVNTEISFFNKETAKNIAKNHGKADLIIANNVMAHVPDLGGFIAGFKELLKPQGVVTVEFPHVLNLLNECQFDTIYHEHFSYLSLMAAKVALKKNELMIFDVEELPTHGGSLRLFVQHVESGSRKVTHRVENLLQRERKAGLDSLDAYRQLSVGAERIKSLLIEFLKKAKSEGKSVCAYGAAAKGNTLLNYCGITKDEIDFVIDRNTEKQGCFLPGSRIPVLSPDEISTHKPAYVLILPWNLKEEIVSSLDYVREWGGCFVVAIPELQVIS